MAVDRFYHDGSEVICMWGAESAGYPNRTATTYGSATIDKYFTFADKPNITKYAGVEPGFGVGSAESQFDIYSQRYAEISGATRLGNVTANAAKLFLQACNRGSGGYKNLADLALYLGKSNANSDGAAEAYRFCKCTRYDLVLQQDREILFTPTFRSLGWPNVLTGGSIVSPAYAALAASVNPLDWVNLTDITIGGTTYRDAITGMTLNVDHGVVADNTRPMISTGGAEYDISRAAYLLKPGHLVITGTLNLNANLDEAQVRTTIASILWGNIVVTVSDTAAGGSLSYVWTLGGSRPRTITQQGGEARGQVTYQVPFTAKTIALV